MNRRLKNILLRQTKQRVRRIIRQENYEGVRDQDGWETLMLTVRSQYPEVADAILKVLVV